MTIDDVDVKSLHARIYQAPSLADRIAHRYAVLGQQAFVQLAPPEHYTAQQAERFRQALLYLAHLHEDDGNEGDPVPNPFTGLPRDALVAIEEDEQQYTEMERYAAKRVKNHLDDQYFGRLIDFTGRTGDGRLLTQGFIEFLDRISAVERLNYPENHRDHLKVLLAAEESRLGRLPEGFTLWGMLEWAVDDHRDLASLLPRPRA